MDTIDSAAGLAKSISSLSPEIRRQLMANDMSFIATNKMKAAANWLFIHDEVADKKLQCKTHQIELFLKELSLASGNIPYAIIKGYSFQRYIYGTTLLRDVGDVDILLKAEDLPRIHNVLYGIGFRQKIVPNCQSGGLNYLGSLSCGGSDINYSDVPIKCHPFHDEYFPYMKKDMPTVELHEGFSCLSAGYVEDIVKDAGLNELHLVENPFQVFLLLILNAYENFESFYSVAYDDSVALRDFVDIDCFVRKNNKKIITEWTNKLTQIDEFARRTQVVINALTELYPECDLYADLRKTFHYESRWHNGAIKRLTDSKSSRLFAISELKANLERNSIPAKQIERVKFTRFLLPYKDEFVCTLDFYPNRIVLTISWLNAGALKDKFIEVLFFNLNNTEDWLLSKIDLFYEDGVFRAFIRKSTRYIPGFAIKKETKYELSTDLTEERMSGRSNVTATIPDSLFGLIDVGRGVVVEVSAMQHYFGPYYWNTSILDNVLLGELEFGKLFYIGGRESGFQIKTRSASFDIDICCPQIANAFKLMFSGLLTVKYQTENINEAPHFVIEVEYVCGCCNEFNVFLDGLLFIESVDYDSLLCKLLGLIEELTIKSLLGKCLAAHASMISIDGFAVVFFGESNCGKTTAALNLSEMFEYCCDELVYIDPINGLAYYDGFPAQVKITNTEMILKLRDVDFVASKSDAHGKVQYYPHIELKTASQSLEGCPIRLLILLSYDSDVDFKCSPVDYDELPRVILSSVLSGGDRGQIFARFVNMVSRFSIPIVKVQYSSVDDLANYCNLYAKEAIDEL